MVLHVIICKLHFHVVNYPFGATHTLMHQKKVLHFPHRIKAYFIHEHKN
jgi:hypothetical protein